MIRVFFTSLKQCRVACRHGSPPGMAPVARRCSEWFCHVLPCRYVDLIFCHRPDPTTPIEETVRAMNYLIDHGQAFYWGTSEWSAQQITEVGSLGSNIVSLCVGTYLCRLAPNNGSYLCCALLLNTGLCLCCLALDSGRSGLDCKVRMWSVRQLVDANVRCDALLSRGGSVQNALLSRGVSVQNALLSRGGSVQNALLSRSGSDQDAGLYLAAADAAFAQMGRALALMPSGPIHPRAHAIS
jgi:Aldo/keto reductase family